MSKSTLPPNPFSHPESFGSRESSSSRSATSGFGDGIKVSSPGTKTGDAAAPQKAGDPSAKSAVAGFGQGKSVASKALESGDIPHAKKNPFDRKPPGEAQPAEAKSLRPEATQVKPPTGLGSESGTVKKVEAPNIVTTSGGLEVTQVKAPSPEEFSKRLQEVLKPVTSADFKQVTADNYMKFHEVKEKEKVELKQTEIKQQIEAKKVEETIKHNAEDQNRTAAETQAQLSRNAALAHQARELQGRMAQLRGHLGGENDAGIHAAIEECRIALAQIPAGLQG